MLQANTETPSINTPSFPKCRFRRAICSGVLRAAAIARASCFVLVWVQAPELRRRLSLQFNPQKRISAEDFYAHPYLGGNRPDLLELAGGAAQVASTLQEHQALQLEAKVLNTFELEALITQACARVQQRRAQAGQQ